MLPVVGLYFTRPHIPETEIKTKLSTVGWNKAPTVGNFVLFQFYFTVSSGLNTMVLSRALLPYAEDLTAQENNSTTSYWTISFTIRRPYSNFTITLLSF